jgi:hypothetical protein
VIFRKLVPINTYLRELGFWMSKTSVGMTGEEVRLDRRHPCLQRRGLRGVKPDNSQDSSSRRSDAHAGKDACGPVVTRNRKILSRSFGQASPRQRTF